MRQISVYLERRGEARCGEKAQAVWVEEGCGKGERETELEQTEKVALIARQRGNTAG